MLSSWLGPRLDKARAEGLWRQSRQVTRLGQGRVEVAGFNALDLAGNDYLALAAAGQGFGGGATASPLVSGQSEAHQQLCDELADWLGFESVRLFSSGFAANCGVLKLFGEVPVFHDRLNHASLLDGSLQSGTRFRRYRHQDLAQLQGLLKTPSLIVSDGVFSMDGDTADIPALKALGQTLYIDDAHGIGVLGENGRGLMEQQGAKPDILMATFGKALGAGGAFVAGPQILGEAIDNLCREYIYSTALPLATVNLVQSNLKKVQSEPWRREKLGELIRHFQAGCRQRDIAVLASDTAIQPVLCQDSAAALALSQRLLEAGFFCPAIRPPTVPQARLRITLNAGLSTSQLDALLDCLEGSHGPC
ncbi:MAG: 8-amino-7-oxononanoate synthase [Pseudomonadota bacterium]|uniref:aminotransferase class I/II-fold pyridoxal phosphate-dependent enzyme n=1 Tax=Gallaecimonas pentaromativorans TaxID=584787 RepID=UPI00067F2640|nr:8-amino-7-oxononanoate synthase [Gallaecimonas pentaromativorans]MED5525353.1 8-amino-7-oxononanoate synthase [Pseudomonadota bacterium]